MARAKRPEALAFELLARQFVELTALLGKHDVAAAQRFLDQTEVTFQQTSLPSARISPFNRTAAQCKVPYELFQP